MQFELRDQDNCSVEVTAFLMPQVSVLVLPPTSVATCSTWGADNRVKQKTYNTTR